MHWKVGRVNCTFKVRVRRGWADLRAFLAEVRRGWLLQDWRSCGCGSTWLYARCAAAAGGPLLGLCRTARIWSTTSQNDCAPNAPLPQNADRFEVFVCSKGKREYIQLLWLMLDPAGQLIPQQGARALLFVHCC
jgi:hypothetical protein